MKKTTKITLSGGFHISNNINVIISSSDYNELKNGNMGLIDALSDSQLNRLNRHFCGVRGCQCGGVIRAKWEA